MNTLRKSWVLRLPLGLQEQAGWVFIGVMCAISGLAYMFGISESSITQILSDIWLRLWGGFLATSGLLISFSTIFSNRALEKMSLRFLSLGLLVYMGWVLIAVSIQRSTFAVFMCLSLIALSEIRVAMLKIILKPLPDSVLDLEEPR